MDREQIFDEDYLYFYEPVLTDERSDAETELIWRLAALEPGVEVLDLACGHGRIANRLASRGARVTGLDATPLFLERARADATARHVEADYVEGDMRSLPWTERFDAVLLWFTTFGMFADDENRVVLREIYRALRPGGRLVLDLNNLAGLLRAFQPATFHERDGDFVIDRHAFDVGSSRVRTERIVVRGSTVRRFSYEVRVFFFAELRDWLVGVGFESVDVFDANGDPLTLDGRRMVTVAQRSCAAPRE